MASTTHTTGNRPPFLKASATVDQVIRGTDGQSPASYGSHEWLNSSGRNGRERRNWHRSGFVGGLWIQLCYALIDVVCVLVNGALAFGIRFSASDLWHAIVSRTIATTIRQSMAHNWGFLLLYAALILLFCRFQDLYSTPRTRFAWEESFAVAKAVSFATLLLTAFIYLSGVSIISRVVVVASFLLNMVTLSTWRYVKRKIVIRRVERGIGARNAVIVGAGKVGQALARQLDENKLWGYRFKGFLDANHSGDPRLLGKIEDLPRIARAEFVDEVFITIPSERELVKSVAMEAGQFGLHVTVVPDMYDGLGWHAPLRYLGGFPLMDLEWQTIPSFGLYVKRALDIVASRGGVDSLFSADSDHRLVD